MFKIKKNMKTLAIVTSILAVGAAVLQKEGVFISFGALAIIFAGFDWFFTKPK